MAGKSVMQVVGWNRQNLVTHQCKKGDFILCVLHMFYQPQKLQRCSRFCADRGELEAVLS